MVVENIRVSKKGKVIGYTYGPAFVEYSQDVNKVIEMCKATGVPFKNQSLKGLCEKVVGRNYCLPVSAFNKPVYDTFEALGPLILRGMSESMGGATEIDVSKAYTNSLFHTETDKYFYDYYSTWVATNVVASNAVAKDHYLIHIPGYGKQIMNSDFIKLYEENLPGMLGEIEAYLKPTKVMKKELFHDIGAIFKGYSDMTPLKLMIDSYIGGLGVMRKSSYRGVVSSDMNILLAMFNNGNINNITRLECGLILGTE